jgi:hypothetical protein
MAQRLKEIENHRKLEVEAMEMENGTRTQSRVKGEKVGFLVSYLS